MELKKKLVAGKKTVNAICEEYAISEPAYYFILQLSIFDKPVRISDLTDSNAFYSAASYISAVAQLKNLGFIRAFNVAPNATSQLYYITPAGLKFCIHIEYTFNNILLSL